MHVLSILKLISILCKRR
uniref:Uncharacterized protein n=1 Tax=Arundo donax TaxID=35708 RepID=A0A0A9B548_ARUDO